LEKNLEHIGEAIRNIRPKNSVRALSDEAGEGEQYTCPICLDAHFVHPLREDGKPDYSKVVPCQCMIERIERERMQRLLTYCELPAGTAHMTFENFKVTPKLQAAYDSAVHVAEGTGEVTWLTLLAAADRGKTHLAVAICRHRIQRGKPARYAYVPLLFEELRRGFREEGDRSYEARFDRLLNVPLLVLDDLGAEYRTDWVQEKLDTIIDYRLMQGLPLVVTTNKPLDELPFRIASRLKRASNSKVVVIDSPEFRSVKKL
jgi:DNA replication protein DnaC